MKAIIINSILIAISIIYCTYFRLHVKHRYGLLSSISKSAKYLTQDGNQVLFFMFILSICILAYVSSTFITIFSAAIIFSVGLITGYNPNLKNKKLEDFLHVAMVNLAIFGFMIGIILINYWLTIVVALFGIPCIVMWVKKVYQHTRRIEWLIIYMVWTSLIIQYVILSLINYEF